MVWSFGCLALRRSLELILLCFRPADAKEVEIIEILVSPPALAVLRRQHPRPAGSRPTVRAVNRVRGTHRFPEVEWSPRRRA